jgi:signal transduction histidine kinase
MFQARQHELRTMAGNSSVQNYLRTANIQRAAQSELTDRLPLDSSLLPAGNEQNELRAAIAPLLINQRFYSALAAFSPDKRLLFLAEPPRTTEGDILFRTDNLLAEQISPDHSVWTTNELQAFCNIVSRAALGTTIRCSTPIFLSEERDLRGALVADLKIDALIVPVAPRLRVQTRPSTMVLVLDKSGTIVYHSNDALKYQPVSTSMPYFSQIANSMIAGQNGTQFYRSTEGDSWLAAYGPLMPPHLSLAVARNYSLATLATRRSAWLTLVLAFLIGIGATFFLTNYYLRKTQSIDRLAEGVGAIAKGELDHRIELLSSDDLRPLADNVDLMTKQIREQIAREAESRQFQSFVRLSAVLTHDLKNAIEALSLTVSNMDRHFENAEFRADAMKTLRGATENLKSLVARLSQPVTTLSGEHKRPRPADLVPMLRRVISMTADQVDEAHETKINLPDSLFAYVDVERMEKVVENLILNALEAMAEKRGTLSIEAGTAGEGKVFFSVSDTGVGMSSRFIQERLFHPFATTKRRGVGLGLYTCREVVRANGGSIEVVSHPGAGTTFRVVLPSAAIDTSGESRPQNQPHR